MWWHPAAGCCQSSSRTPQRTDASDGVQSCFIFCGLDSGVHFDVQFERVSGLGGLRQIVTGNYVWLGETVVSSWPLGVAAAGIYLHSPKCISKTCSLPPSRSVSIENQEEAKGSLRLSKKSNLTVPISATHIITTHIITTHIITTHILTMATINTTTDQIAITTKKLQDVEISESELPQTPPAEDLHTTITSVLLPQLSKTASIYLPSEELFKKYTSRWSDTTFTAPTAVVNVTAETDISAVVRLPLHLPAIQSQN